MPRTFEIDLYTRAYAVTRVTFSDEQIAKIAHDLEINVEDITQEMLFARAVDENFDTPYLCHQCAGGYDSWHSTPSLELNDEWEVFDETVREITK